MNNFKTYLLKILSIIEIIMMCVIIIAFLVLLFNPVLIGEAAGCWFDRFLVGFESTVE
jgi:hypothetical protein